MLRLVGVVLGEDVIGAYLYGSAVEGGLRPRSDLDVFVLTRRPATFVEKRALVDGLLPLSGRHAATGPARSIELTVVCQGEVRPWRYPPTLDFQYGDWLRSGFERGELPAWPTPSPDLAVLLTTVVRSGRPLSGPSPVAVLDPVPAADLERAMLDSLPDLLADLGPDTANVLLTLARIWTTLGTGEIRTKDAAADWAAARLPPEHRPVLARARAVYLGTEPDAWDDVRLAVEAHAAYVVAAIRALARARRLGR